MFTQNNTEPMSLTPEQSDNTFYLLYYQLIKHGFGLQYADLEKAISLRLNFDKLPQNKEKTQQFKSYICNLCNIKEFRNKNILLTAQDISEVDSQKHDVLQCLDIIMGVMQFRLNNGHKKTSKRSKAKYEVYKAVYSEIKALFPDYKFNPGVSTAYGATLGSLSHRWSNPYAHWLFKPMYRKQNPSYISKNIQAPP
ncbi:MAG: hypothetical protein VKJ06_08530 [Vampirovibrionales bacterium]|nr:hypothetical protein [Vampirovibrionales bacterium]